MNCASSTGVEAVDGTKRIDRCINVVDRRADKSLLHRTTNALSIARSDIPSSRNDDLITSDATIVDMLVMIESATRCFPHAAAIARKVLRCAEVLAVATLECFDEFVDPSTIR